MAQEQETIQILNQRIRELERKLEIKEWAAQKTNAGIRILYKELEKKHSKLGRASEKLRRSEERFRLALQSSPMYIAHLDGRLRTVWSYDAQSKFFPKLLGDPSASALAGTMRAVLESGRGVQKEYQFKVKGSTLTYDVILEPLERRAGLTLVALNVSERKRVEEELRRNERKQKEFVANVSHDFRTPIAAIKGFVETLQRGGLADSKNRERFLDIIARHADRLENLVSDLLDLSMLESGQWQAQRELIHLGGFVAERLREMLPLLRESKIRARVRVDRNLRVWADRGELEKVLINVLSNAVKFNRPGGWIRISAGLAKGRVRVCVEDNGIGIPPKDLPYVFDRFYKVDKARTKAARDSGLGLNIVKKIVESNGGKAWAKSRFGEGSAFYFTFPARPSKSLAQEPRDLGLQAG